MDASCSASDRAGWRRSSPPSACRSTSVARGSTRRSRCSGRRGRAASSNNDGRHYPFDRVLATPAPCDVPLVLGGNTDRALRRAARLADGWFSSGNPTFDEAVRLRARLSELCDEVGREPSTADLRAHGRARPGRPGPLRRARLRARDRLGQPAVAGRRRPGIEARRGSWRPAPSCSHDGPAGRRVLRQRSARSRAGPPAEATWHRRHEPSPARPAATRPSGRRVVAADLNEPALAGGGVRGRRRRVLHRAGVHRARPAGRAHHERRPGRVGRRRRPARLQHDVLVPRRARSACRAWTRATRCPRPSRAPACRSRSSVRRCSWTTC